MPKTAKGEKIYHAMQEEYGPEKGERVFYAARNKGTIAGVDAITREGKKIVPSRPAPRDACHQTSYMDAVRRGDSAGMTTSSAHMLRGRMVR